MGLARNYMNIIVSHVYMEGNVYAHSLANISDNCHNLTTIWLDIPLAMGATFHRDDLVSLLSYRLVP
jgi:hypothetical protein